MTDRPAAPSSRAILAFLLALLSAASAFCEGEGEGVRLFAAAPGTFRQTQKYNLSKYVDGEYVGHVYRETRAVIESSPGPGGSLIFDGTFFVGEETTRESFLERKVDEAVQAKFSVSPEGRFSFSQDSGHPDLRDFPSFPDEPVLPGARWEGRGSRVVDPENSGVKTVISVLSEFTFVGRHVYRSRAVLTIKAKYATRYRKGQSRTADPELDRLEGTHDVSILLDALSLEPILMSEDIDEQYRYVSGRQLRLKGKILTFWSVVPALDRGSEIAGLKQTFTDSGIEGIDVGDRPEGIALSVSGIRFKADSDEILAAERGRLDSLAQALKAVKGERSFMVEGHTADVGQAENQYRLSEDRARRVVAELVSRGIAASRFLYKGYGADRPVAPNDTEGNRAKNRRVEIVILGD